MPKAKLKTTKTKKSVKSYIDAIKSPKRKRDAEHVLELMTKITKEKPAMWGPSIVGFGDHTYKYESGREIDFFVIGFSSRKDCTTLYGLYHDNKYDDLLEKLGPYKRGAGCLYIKDMSEIHEPTLKKMIQRGYKAVKSGKSKGCGC